jgi:hypothetical protein
MRNCKVKTTGIALSVDASVPPASAARGMGVHALSNHGRARAQDATPRGNVARLRSFALDPC